MIRALRVALALVALAGLGALLVWAFLAGRAERAAERERERPVAAPQRTSRGPGGEVLVTLDGAAQRRIGLDMRALAATTLRSEVVAFGVLDEDPLRSFTLRAPVSGTLRSAERGWPEIGAVLDDGAGVGAIEPRMAPVSQVDLASRLASAQAEVEAAGAALAAVRAAYERTRTLNAEGKIVSDRAVQDAEARMKGEEARLTAARKNASLIQRSLRAAAGPTGPISLRVDRGGQVMEVLARPGEAIESGQPILKLARFDTLVARVDVPPGEPVDTSATTARIVVLGEEDHPFAAARIGLGATDPRTQGHTWLFRVRSGGRLLSPGQAVTAYLPGRGPSVSGVVVPPRAVVRFQGKEWVYLETGPGQFTRREIALDPPAAGFVAPGLQPGDRVVVEGAQALLSEELKSETQYRE